MALISLEDLEGLDDEQLDEEVTDRSEPMNEEENDRMYAHWQAVGRTHQVSVPTGNAVTNKNTHGSMSADLRTALTSHHE